MSFVFQILHVAFILAFVLILFNVLIVVHELGHFLAARWRGMVVEKFAIWFGKPLWKRKIGGVEYILGSIPAGGYVALPQMAPMDAIEGESEHKREELPPVSPWDKIIVAFAGPLFSFGLALVFAFIVWNVGHPVTDWQNSLIIGYVKPGSGADQAGLKPGDRIVSVDGRKVTKFFGMGSSVTWRIVSSVGEKIPFVVERDGVQLPTIDVVPTVKPSEGIWERGNLRQAGIAPGVFMPTINGVMSRSPAEIAGLKAGDRVTHINGERLYSDAPINAFIESNPGKPLNLTILRDHQPLQIELLPLLPVAPKGIKDPRTGIEWDSGLKLDYPNPWEQVVSSVDAIVSTLGALFSPGSKVSASHLSGPLGIINIYGVLFQSDEGWRLVLWLSVVINVNLALVNLLPIPVLDGGHITLALIELIRRKPINPRILEYVQVSCAVLIIMFMIYVTTFDIQDFGRLFQPRQEAMRWEIPHSAPPQ
jgi:regulator of sigma E protease